MKPLLNAEGLWDIHLQVLSEAGSFGYYGYLIRKVHDNKEEEENATQHENGKEISGIATTLSASTFPQQDTTCIKPSPAEAA